MITAEVGQPALALALVTQDSVAATVADASTKASIALRIPTAHARRINVLLSSTAAVTAYLRIGAAQQRLLLDSAGTACGAGSTVGLHWGAAAGEPIGDTAELVISNASGSIATVVAAISAV